MRVYRSPLKLFLFGMIGIVLIVAAVDVMFGHWLSILPDHHEGVLTTRGEAQQRGDLLWGGAMGIAGILLVIGSIIDLLRRRPSFVVDGAGMHVGSGTTSARKFVPWGTVEAIVSDVARDPYDGSQRERLIVEKKIGVLTAEGSADADTVGVDDAEGKNVDVTGDQDTLYVDAHDWTVRVTEVSLASQGAHDHFMRVEKVLAYKLPSIEWEVTMSQTTPDVDSVEEESLHGDGDDDNGDSDSTDSDSTKEAT